MHITMIHLRCKTAEAINLHLHFNNLFGRGGDISILLFEHFIHTKHLTIIGNVLNYIVWKNCKEEDLINKEYSLWSKDSKPSQKPVNFCENRETRFRPIFLVHQKPVGYK
jgi:hypothetical protein